MLVVPRSHSVVSLVSGDVMVNSFGFMGLLLGRGKGQVEEIQKWPGGGMQFLRAVAFPSFKEN